MRRFMSIAFVVLALGPLAACGDRAAEESSSADTAPEPAADPLREVATDYAAELGVDLDVARRTDSGLRFQELAEGEGEPAQPGDRVFVHYTGWLPDGTEFDSSVDRGEPIDFILGAGEVVDGWDEGITGMRPGGRRRLVIPPALGYGEAGRGPIPPGSTMVFDVELVRVGDVS